MSNVVILVGRVGKIKNFQVFPSGSLLTFSVATTERVKKNDGTWISETDWHTVKVWGKQAEAMNNMMSQGDLVFVMGANKSEKYISKDGRHAKIHYVKAKQITVQTRSSSAEADPDDNPLDNEEIDY